MEPLFFVPNDVEEVFCWSEWAVVLAQKKAMMRSCKHIVQNKTTMKQKTGRGSAAPKAACVQGDTGDDEVWNWSFAFQDVQTLHIRNCKSEFKRCGIQ